jgi:hypothetical protein
MKTYGNGHLSEQKIYVKSIFANEAYVRLTEFRVLIERPRHY